MNQQCPLASNKEEEKRALRVGLSVTTRQTSWKMVALLSLSFSKFAVRPPPKLCSGTITHEASSISLYSPNFREFIGKEPISCAHLQPWYALESSRPLGLRV